MANVHVHLHVSDLEASRSFYQRFLGAEPVKLRPGYVKFLPGLAPINLALTAGQPNQGRNVDHLGFEVESRERVAELMARVKASGLAVREEIGTDCCYANQDKFWVTDPDGIEWEIYHVNHDVDVDGRRPEQLTSTGCCPPAPLARIGKRT
jgi:catechol 2,3-dioxygenase-like lactoylglutathione lyase family enzyme